MRNAVRTVAVAFQLLTRFPVPDVPVRDGDLRRAAAAFPLVGVAVAAVGVALRAALTPWWGTATATVVAVLAMVAVTGAFHEDGLADTADGLWGGTDPDQRLRIMRDSRIGTYGAVALVGVLALRVTLLASVDLTAFARAVVCGHVLGRASTLVLARRLPAAAAGSGASVVGALGRTGTALAGLTVAVVLVATAGRWLLVPLGAGVLVLGLCARLFRRRLGGITGDTLGAATALVDLVAIAAIVALVRAGWR